MKLTHISLFAGIGGIDLAAEWAGFETILFVEIDSYCQKVLRKHWPDVPIIGDIRDVTKEKIIAYTYPEGQPVISIDGDKGCRKLGQERNRGIDSVTPITLITGGFPCQPVSHAGKRRGKEDDRWLWPEMLRVISEIRSTWVVAENVAGLLNMGFNDCVSDLEGEGYEVQSFLIPACAINAPHRRDRIFIVGYSEHAGLYEKQESRGLEPGGFRRNGKEGEGPTRESKGSDSSIRGAGDVADTTGEGLQDRGRPQVGEPREKSEPNRCNSQPTGLQDDTGITAGERWWAVEPELGRVAHGIPNRVDRLKCLGNAVVPQQIYPILKAIADIEGCK